MTISPRPILIAEDDPNDAFMLRRAFDRAGIANPLVFVADGVEAVDYLSGRGPDDGAAGPPPAVMLLDLKMPRRSGFEVLEWLRAQPGLGTLPVVVLTGSNEPKDIARAYELGATRISPSPVRRTNCSRRCAASASTGWS